jgi:hypothetical protein
LEFVSPIFQAMETNFVLKKEQGQSLVEFAFVFGIMLLAAFIFLNLCLGTYYQIQLTRLAHDIARVESLSEFEDASDTDQKIDLLLFQYQSRSAFPIDLLNDNMFFYTIHEQFYNPQMQFITVQVNYAGFTLPFTGWLNVSSSIVYPKITSEGIP